MKKTKAQIRKELLAHFRDMKRRGFAPPINAGGRRPWSWAPVLKALAVGALLAALPALAGQKWGKICEDPPAPKKHYLSCPKGEHPAWFCYHPMCPPGICEPEAWQWAERCEVNTPKPKG